MAHQCRNALAVVAVAAGGFVTWMLGRNQQSLMPQQPEQPAIIGEHLVSTANNTISIYTQRWYDNLTRPHDVVASPIPGWAIPFDWLFFAPLVLAAYLALWLLHRVPSRASDPLVVQTRLKAIPRWLRGHLKRALPTLLWTLALQLLPLLFGLNEACGEITISPLPHLLQLLFSVFARSASTIVSGVIPSIVAFLRGFWTHVHLRRINGRLSDDGVRKSATIMRLMKERSDTDTADRASQVFSQWEQQHHRPWEVELDTLRPQVASLERQNQKLVKEIKQKDRDYIELKSAMKKLERSKDVELDSLDDDIEQRDQIIAQYKQRELDHQAERQKHANDDAEKARLQQQLNAALGTISQYTATRRTQPEEEARKAKKATADAEKARSQLERKHERLQQLYADSMHEKDQRYQRLQHKLEDAMSEKRFEVRYRSDPETAKLNAENEELQRSLTAAENANAASDQTVRDARKSEEAAQKKAEASVNDCAAKMAQMEAQNEKLQESLKASMSAKTVFDQTAKDAVKREEAANRKAEAAVKSATSKSEVAEKTRFANAAHSDFQQRLEDLETAKRSSDEEAKRARAQENTARETAEAANRQCNAAIQQRKNAEKERDEAKKSADAMWAQLQQMQATVTQPAQTVNDAQTVAQMQELEGRLSQANEVVLGLYKGVVPSAEGQGSDLPSYKEIHKLIWSEYEALKARLSGNGKGEVSRASTLPKAVKAQQHTAGAMMVDETPVSDIASGNLNMLSESASASGDSSTQKADRGRDEDMTGTGDPTSSQVDWQPTASAEIAGTKLQSSQTQPRAVPQQQNAKSAITDQPFGAGFSSDAFKGTTFFGSSSAATDSQSAFGGNAASDAATFSSSSPRQGLAQKKAANKPRLTGRPQLDRQDAKKPQPAQSSGNGLGGMSGHSTFWKT